MDARYDQYGDFPLTFDISDGHADTLVSTNITVQPGHGPVSIDPLGTVTFYQGQAVNLHLVVHDANQPLTSDVLSPLAAENPDTVGLPPIAVAMAASTLPVGAAFDGATHDFSWTPALARPTRSPLPSPPAMPTRPTAWHPPAARP